jgi:hypothetical protein
MENPNVRDAELYGGNGILGNGMDLLLDTFR